MIWRKPNLIKRKSNRLGKAVWVMFLMILLLPAIAFLLPVILRMSLADTDYTHPKVPRDDKVPYVQELYKELKDVRKYGSDNPGTWGDYGPVWNRIFSAALRDVPVETEEFLVDRQLWDLYRSQAYVVFDDWKLSSLHSHSKGYASSWSKVYEQGNDVVWRDGRTGLHWSKSSAESMRNNFVMRDCSAFNFDDRGEWESSIANCGDAFAYCRNLDVGGRDDWYLPSRDELSQAYINGMYIETDPSFVTDKSFWSSTERFADVNYAWSVYLNNGLVLADSKNSVSNNYVRCVARDYPVERGEVRRGGGYALQSLVNFDDSRFDAEVNYAKPSSSSWTEISDGDIWRDDRTGLYWSDVRGDRKVSNDFDISGCSFFSVNRGGYEGGYEGGDNACGSAINICAALNNAEGGDGFGGRKGWYLPSIDEYAQAYLNGMYLNTNKSFVGDANFWSSTQSSKVMGGDGSGYAWSFYLNSGASTPNLEKSSSGAYVRCVSRE